MAITKNIEHYLDPPINYKKKSKQLFFDKFKQDIRAMSYRLVNEVFNRIQDKKDI